MLVSLTVGKVDAGVTVLLTEDKRLIEFPSILLPPNISSGSIVDITVGRNRASEQKAQDDFAALQARIHQTFGVQPPTTPVLRCRNATQTSVVLEWDPIQLATADLLSLSLYRNDQKAGNIPRPLQMHSTKISGLAVDTPYTFHLVLRTSAGVFASNKLAVRTHKMTDLSGITITTGILQPPALRERLAAAVERIGAKLVPEPGVVRIDTTHFVTTEGRGVAWEKATELSIPVVRPDWVEACEKSGRILGVTKFYLDAVRPSGGLGASASASASVSASASASPGPGPTAPPPPPQHDKTLPPAPAETTTTSSSSPAPTPAPAAAPSSSSSSSSSAATTPPAATAAAATTTTTTPPQQPQPAAAASEASVSDGEEDAAAADEDGKNKADKGKLPLRTKDQQARDEDSEEDDDEEEAGDDEKADGKNASGNDSSLKAAAPSSGDGNSFQDVAL